MDKKMEKIISKDLGISADSIRNSSWESLEKRRRRISERAFRPKGMFPIGGNINLTLGREMSMFQVTISEMIRRVTYRIKCLLKFKKHV